MTQPRHTEGATEAEHAAFEAWFCRGGDYEPEWLDKSGANHALYMNADTENMWQAWQARSSLPTSKQAGGAEVERLREQRDALARALEVIAVGDAVDPVRDAGDELVALGYWNKECLDGYRALPPAPNQGEAA